MSSCVSVIIPTYNRAAVIARAITSVLAQDYTPLEIIVVDDASTDDTQRVVERFGDARIR
jgi:glycosyltransferase involved in cell wall biosynthesis